MNILMANWSWYPTGGDWTYIKSICDLYEANGHKIIPFSTHNEKNYKTEYSKYFINQIDYKDLNERKNFKAGFKVLTKSLYSFEAKQKLKMLLDENTVDIAQFNNINNYQTPGIIPVLRKRKVPVIWRILDYKLICPNTTFVSKNKICEACFKHKYYNCLLRKCKKNSASASLVAAIESYIYYLLPFYKQVNKFLFQSQFSRDMFVKYGFDITKTEIIENPYNCESIHPNFTSKKYILYFGRLERIKGIFTLFEAMKMLPDIELKVVGNGTENNRCVEYLENNSIFNVTLMGPKWGDDLTSLIQDCCFVVVPSEWFEPSPYVVLQSFSNGKPVVASNLGGLNDLVRNQENGIIFPSGDSASLAQAIKDLWQNEKLIHQMGVNSRKFVENQNNPAKYYAKTMNIFESLIKEEKRST